MSSGLVIFDIDGTLFQAQRVTIPAVQRTLAKHGLAVPGDREIASFFGRPVEEYHAWLAGFCPPGKMDAIIAETDALELALIQDEGALYDGVPEALTELKAAGYTLASCSNGPIDYVDAVLDGHKLRPFFEIAICKGMGYAGKEAMVGDLLNRLPQRPAFVVGDREDDIAAAHAHGAQAVAAAYGFGGDTEWLEADARAESPSDIPPMIAALRTPSSQT